MAVSVPIVDVALTRAIGAGVGEVENGILVVSNALLRHVFSEEWIDPACDIAKLKHKYVS